jgi:hypothetical protein
MNENVPIASYTELLKRRLNAVRTLARSLRESQGALLAIDPEQSGQFTEQQIDLCNEIEFLDRDLRSADEILAWAKALKPDNREILQIRRHTKSAETQLAQTCMVHGSLLRRAKRSVTVMMNSKTKESQEYSPSSVESLRFAEEV